MKQDTYTVGALITDPDGVIRHHVLQVQARYAVDAKYAVLRDHDVERITSVTLSGRHFDKLITK